MGPSQPSPLSNFIFSGLQKEFPYTWVITSHSLSPQHLQQWLNQKQWECGPADCVMTNLSSSDDAKDHCPLSLPCLVGTSGLQPFWGNLERADSSIGKIYQWISISSISSLTVVLCTRHLLSAAACLLCILHNCLHALIHQSSLSHCFLSSKGSPSSFFLLTYLKIISERSECKYLCSFLKRSDCLY